MSTQQDRPAPDYVTNTVEERDVTVDWFFGKGHLGKTIGQGVLGLIGWFFAILPIVITESALVHRDDSGGWWNYREGFAMWDVTIKTLGFLLVVFVIWFFSLYLLYRRKARDENDEKSFDEEKLALRLALARDLYTSKYGDEELRMRQQTIRIEPYADFETFELRDLYRAHGVD